MTAGKTDGVKKAPLARKPRQRGFFYGRASLEVPHQTGPESVEWTLESIKEEMIEPSLLQLGGVPSWGRDLHESESEGVFPMLVLARRVGEEIVIGGDIRVTVLDVRGNQIRLGVVAPQSVRVLRQELEHRPAESVNAPLVRARSSQPSYNDPQIMAGLMQIAR